MKWYFSYPEEYDVKSHIIPETLLKEVIDNLYSRGVSHMCTKEIKSEDEIGFDLPGMIMTDRKWCSFTIDGLKIKMPYTDIEAILQKLENLGVRNEIGQKYYKLHGFYRCLCLTTEQKNLFIEEIRKILPEAKSVAAVENQIFNDRIFKNPSPYILVNPRPAPKKGQPN